MRVYVYIYVSVYIYSFNIVAYIIKIFMFSVYMYISALYILFAPGSYTSHWLMFFVVNTTGNKAYFILSYHEARDLRRHRAHYDDILMQAPHYRAQRHSNGGIQPWSKQNIVYHNLFLTNQSPRNYLHHIILIPTSVNSFTSVRKQNPSIKKNWLFHYHPRT